MNRDDILRMAQECGLVINDQPMLGVERFAALVAAAEREKYESVIETLAKLAETYQKSEGVAIDMIAAAVAVEREACARMAEDCVNIEKLADDIRAREDMRENLRDMMDEVGRDWPATKQTLGG